MALKPILDLVKNRLPFLSASDDVLVNDFITETYYYLQSYLAKPDADVETEASYTGLQRMLIADMTAYDLVKRKAIQTTGGTAGAAPETKILKRAKADVTEAEFVVTTARDGSLIQISTTDFLATLKEAICHKASALLLTLPLCAQDAAGDEPAGIGFIYIG